MKPFHFSFGLLLKPFNLSIIFLQQPKWLSLKAYRSHNFLLNTPYSLCIMLWTKYTELPSQAYPLDIISCTPPSCSFCSSHTGLLAFPQVCPARIWLVVSVLAVPSSQNILLPNMGLATLVTSGLCANDVSSDRSFCVSYLRQQLLPLTSSLWWFTFILIITCHININSY